MTQRTINGPQESSYQSTALKVERRYQNLHINGEIEQLQCYFQQICQSFAGRKHEITHIISKVECSLQERMNVRQIDVEVGLSQIESSLNAKLNESSEDLDQIQSILREFVMKEWQYFHGVCMEQAADEKKLIESIMEAAKKKVEELKAILSKEKFQAREGVSILKIHNLLRQKCALLQKQLGMVKDNTAKCKKQVQKQLKSMLKILQVIEEGRSDRESKEECILALIDRIDREDNGESQAHP